MRLSELCGIFVVSLLTSGCASAPPKAYPFPVDCRITGCPGDTRCERPILKERYGCYEPFKPCICLQQLEKWCPCRESQL